jgi:tetratricopeptide (TPR) repeat protein
MAAALRAARDVRPGAPGGTPIPARDTDPDFDRRLVEAQFGNPLNLVMAGLIALDRGPQAALALRRLDAARYIARRELRRLTDLAHIRQIGENEIRHIFAFNGVAGGLPIADLRKTVANELAASHRSTDRVDAVLTLLQQELPPRTEASDQRRIATIQPDLIGEAAIVEAFTGEPSREAEAAEVVRRAYVLDGTAAAQALFRLVQDFAYPVEAPDAAAEEKATGRRIMEWLLNLAGKIEDPEQLLPLVAALPEQTTILREPAAQLTRALADYFVEKAKEDDDPLSVIYSATLLNNLANRLSALGRREEALKAAEEAVGHYRALAEARPDAFIPDLAGSLNNLANVLSALGRREEALKAAEEAVGHYRALAEARPDAFDAELARSLLVLGNLYGGGDEPELAIDILAEAIQRLTPTFFRVPMAVAGMMNAIRQSYLARCEAAGRKPDVELLAPVSEVFAKLQQPEEK